MATRLIITTDPSGFALSKVIFTKLRACSHGELWDYVLAKPQYPAAYWLRYINASMHKKQDGPKWTDNLDSHTFAHRFTAYKMWLRDIEAKVIFAEMPYSEGWQVMFTNAALPRVETASSIRFVFVEASELLQEKADFRWGVICTSLRKARRNETKKIVKDKHLPIFTRQGWKLVQRSRTVSPLVWCLWWFLSWTMRQEVLQGL